MTPQEALDKLYGFTTYLENSIPDYIWEQWQEYHENNDDEIPWEGVDTKECYNTIKAAL